MTLNPTPVAQSVNAIFRQRLLAGETIFGTFVKTPHPAIVEVLGLNGFDFLVLDAEHAPFERTSLDLCILAGRAVGCPVLVRVPSAAPEWIMACLDAGAAGIMAPHVSSPEEATRLVRLLRYRDGERGFSPSPRASEYGRRSIADQLRLAPAETVLVCQIEDAAGVANAAAIAAVDGVDALFIGPVDLAVSLGLDSTADDKVTALCRQTITAANGHARSGIFVADAAAAGKWMPDGASLFVAASDQALLRMGAKAVLKRDDK